MPRVFITSQIPKIAGQMLTQNGFIVEQNSEDQSPTKDELKKIVFQYDAIITLMTDKIDEDVIIHAGKNLKIIANYAVGYDNIDVETAKRKGVIVCNTPGAASESVAEHTFMLILACAKKLVEADRYVRSGKYQKWDPMAFVTPQVWGQTIGIVGLGRIGYYAGHIAFGGFKMKILYYDIVRSSDFEMLTEAEFVPLSALLSQADIITIHVPLTDKTRHLITKKELRMMKSTAILINTSRGAIIHEEDLVWALRERVIAAAGLDVFENEPSIPSELKVLDNVILTPHIASATLETREAMARIAAQNIIDVFEDREPVGLIRIS